MKPDSIKQELHWEKLLRIGGGYENMFQKWNEDLSESKSKQIWNKICKKDWKVETRRKTKKTSQVNVDCGVERSAKEKLDVCFVKNVNPKTLVIYTVNCLIYWHGIQQNLSWPHIFANMFFR